MAWIYLEKHCYGCSYAPTVPLLGISHAQKWHCITFTAWNIIRNQEGHQRSMHTTEMHMYLPTEDIDIRQNMEGMHHFGLQKLSALQRHTPIFLISIVRSSLSFPTTPKAYRRRNLGQPRCAQRVGHGLQSLLSECQVSLQTNQQTPGSRQQKFSEVHHRPPSWVSGPTRLV